MFKKIIALFMIMFFVNTHLSAKDCNLYFREYELDPKIKSVTGWKRIINQDKLATYIPEIENRPFEKFQISKCLITSGLNLSKFGRSIGGLK